MGKLGEFSGAQDASRDGECSVQGVRWRSGATSAETDGGSGESESADPKRHDPGGRRSGTVGTALLDDARDLQGCSSEHRVSGG